MRSLFEEGACGPWKEALEGYSEAVSHRAVSRLDDLDHWYHGELPRLLAERVPPQMFSSELVRVTEWKMKRGLFRGRNLFLVKSNDPDVVARTTAEAFALVPHLRKPVSRICDLAGVGPATASAVLAALRPDLYPFFDEAVAEAIPGLGKAAFTLVYYEKYQGRLRDRARELSVVCTDVAWTAHLVGVALWAASAKK